MRAHASTWAAQMRGDRRTFERRARQVEDTCGGVACRQGTGALSAGWPDDDRHGAHLRDRRASRARTSARARTRTQARACCILSKRRRPNRSQRWDGMQEAARAVGRKAAVLCSTARREPARQRHESGEYVLMRAHGQRKCAGIGAPSNEELVESKIPAEGWRAERAPVPSLLVGPTKKA